MEMKKQPIQPESLVGAEVWRQANKGQAANNGVRSNPPEDKEQRKSTGSKAALVKGKIRERRTKRGLTLT